MKKEIKMALYLLNEAGFEAFLVGGAVRDIILKRKVKDYDINTNATPEEIKNVFSDFNTVDIGKKFGTVLIIINDVHIEITPYRIEEDYLDHRHPSKVTYTYSLYDDISRRDFTINSICMDINENIIDYYNGKQDLKDYTVRCIGNPNDRFKEDALRILRAIRIANEYNFGIEKKTADALIKNAKLLKHISAERKKEELMRILSCRNVSYSLKKYLNVFNEFIPIPKVTTKINDFSSPYYKLAFLMRNTDFDFKELKFSNDEISFLKELINASNKRLTNDYAFIDLLAESKHKQEIIKFLEEKNKKIYRIKHMRLAKYMVDTNSIAINGEELMALGYKNNDISKIKKEIVEEIKRKRLRNSNRDIIKYLKQKMI